MTIGQLPFSVSAVGATGVGNEAETSGRFWHRASVQLACRQPLRMSQHAASWQRFRVACSALQVTQLNQPLLIVAEDVTGDALATLVVNKLRGVLNVAAIKAPGFGERRKSLLQDLAIVANAEFIAKDLGLTVEGATVDQLGIIRKVTLANNTTTVIADAGSKEEIDLRVAQLKKELGDTESVYDTEKLSERIAKLAGGVAVIKVCLPVHLCVQLPF